MICSRSHRLMIVLGNEVSILRSTNNWPIILFFMSDAGICDWRRNLSLRTVKYMREQVLRFSLLGPFPGPFQLFNNCWVSLFGVFFGVNFLRGLVRLPFYRQQKVPELNGRCLFLMEMKLGDKYTELSFLGFFSQNNSSLKSIFTDFIAVWISQSNTWNILWFFYALAARG